MTEIDCKLLQEVKLTEFFSKSKTDLKIDRKLLVKVKWTGINRKLFVGVKLPEMDIN